MQQTYLRCFLISVWIVVGAGCSGDSLHGFREAPKEEPECAIDLDCDIGELCIDLVCVDDCAEPNCGDIPEDGGGDTVTDPDSDPPEPEFPIFVGGEWNTEYHLDWSEYLGPLADLGTPIDMIDQILIGNSDLNSIPLVGPILQQIVDQYIPQWLADLVHLLNGVVHFFQDVRIDADLTLAHVAGSLYDIDAEEDWHTGYVSIIDQCPLGEQDPNYPQCALLEVPLNQYDATVATIGAEALPFSGTIIHGQGFSIEFLDREVRMQISRFVMYVLNEITNLASNGQYTSLDDALTALIDCTGLAAQVNAIIGIDQQLIEGICVGVRDEVINTLTSALDAISVEWEVMEFDQNAAIFDDNSDGDADRFGAPPTEPGALENGGFRVLYGAEMGGYWWGVR